ncbi:alpha tubulin suppressor [Elasticomyces elasticus]|nr:alpha tubulin suppressor [Elasticomyces elasticus]KAK3661884.1 alpha tubulin suppressor [Elasticomyces elasticus]KAK5748570.1 alpha tubulin suppressor [Elasticomyces elasticus]
MASHNDTVFAFGSNGSGQLGLSHFEDISTPEQSSLSGCTVKQIAAGGNHTLMLSEDGNVKLQGDDGHDQTIVRYLSEVDWRVAQLSATWNASMLLLQSGKVLVCGEGQNGELGLGSEISHITSCMAHSVTVLSNGEVWGWGNGRQGQLGEPAEIVWSPRQIQGLTFSAAKVVCGKDFTCVFGNRRESGQVAMFGPKRDRFDLHLNLPSMVVPGWKDVATSWGSIYILRDDGELLGFGRNDHGQLPPPDLPPIEAIAAGSEHCLALTKAGKVLAWGWGEHGNCGEPTDSNGDVKGRWNEVEVPYSVRAVFAGCATSLIVTSAHIEHSGGQG